MPNLKSFIKSWQAGDITSVVAVAPTALGEVQLDDVANIKWENTTGTMWASVASVPPDPGGHITLVEQTALSTYTEGTVLFWSTTPNKLKQWLAFEHFVSTPSDSAIAYRLVQGGVEYYFIAGFWLTATLSTHWNTEQEISVNMSSFAPGTQELGIRARLTPSTDLKSTPTLYGFQALMSVDHVTDEEIIYRTVIRQLRTQVRAVYDYKVTLLSATATIDLNAASYALDDQNLKITGCSAAYNETDDSDLMTDLLSTYAAGVITLSGAQDSADVLILKLFVEPIVAVTTGRLFYESAGPCAIILEDLTHPLRYRGNRSSIITVKETTPSTSHKAHVIPEGYSVDYEFLARYVTRGGVDSTRLVEELRRFFHMNKRLTVPSLDEQVDVTILNEPEPDFRSNLNDVHEGAFSFQVRFVSVRAVGGSTVDLVSTANITGVSA